ncbi:MULTISPECIES: bile acid:sodium symporter family protein [unclassified Pseudodesulfovibrio]|uniref:bile acid:sodium symporter family protein n=1 Tax=unclassified Pseudodesulfovibrio TaxID=2661612 RepID=UPI000FEB7889|nr:MULTISPECIES: bile acid:sodium symporter family protein [unclassified Pseudodesulfovibrio]MCJ2164952.1 bile acid:sodium symporter family protein [Pseudodesulfovibrio sp. S3-i]RWU03618.1 bile acid:sodium symporter family protein [Pseudodesulfovibrio sp. S3]
MTLDAILRFIERNFILIALAMSAAALAHPPCFTWIKPHIPLGLGIIMFGMGLTLDFEDFRDILRKWHLVGLGMVLQFAIMPSLAVGIAYALNLPAEAVVGMVVVGACPGGTASNVIAYLARANVPLSVTLTLASTCLAPVLTPAIIYFLLKQQVEIDFWSMAMSVFWIVVFPLMDGLILRRLFRKRLESILRCFPALSIAVITLLVACIIGLNQQTLLAFPVLVLLAVILHNGLGLTAGYGIARLFRCSKRDARTLAIEVGMQNSGLGVALSIKFFGPAMALPGALFSLWHNLSGVTLAKRWRTLSD